jgi:hypothetical protein
MYEADCAVQSPFIVQAAYEGGPVSAPQQRIALHYVCNFVCFQVTWR